jgi:5-methyltetrahydropteroyltriglutamate--homocysteine methyltransferase
MPMRSANSPFHAEHIGSFLRPAALLEARDARAAGRLSADALRGAEDAAIRDFVALQESLGFQAVTDGEFRRSTYTENLTTSGLSGVSAEQTGDGAWAYTNASGHRERARVLSVNGPIRWQGSTNARDFSFLKEATARSIGKMTLPGPCYIHFRAGRERISREVYPRLEDFWADLVNAYVAELRALANAGCRYVQLDETSIAKLGDPKIREALEARGDPWEALLDQYLSVINAIVTQAPPEMRIGMHLCRGNRMGHWQAAGGYDVVADRVIRGLAIDFFFLEYDSERAGTFEPLALVPDHKAIVLGLVSTKMAGLEPAEQLEAKVRDCARYVGLERLGISPQCGFSSSEKANTIMSHDQAVAKLRRVGEVADRIWG